MEIIRNVWRRVPNLANTAIIHTFNGPEEIWPEPYLEDKLLHLDNPGHYAGAMLLIDEGILAFRKNYPDVEYVVVLAADTWCVVPEYINAVIEAMKQGGRYIASCAWGTEQKENIFQVGMATDFFVVNVKWATSFGLFPMRFQEFREKFGELMLYYGDAPIPERVFTVRFREAIANSEAIPSDNLLAQIAYQHFLPLQEREPVHLNSGGKWQRTMYWPKIGLITHHDPEPKQQALAQWRLNLGEYGNQFLIAQDFGYFNMGITKLTYAKDGKTCDYGE